MESHVDFRTPFNVPAKDGIATQCYLISLTFLLFPLAMKSGQSGKLCLIPYSRNIRVWRVGGGDLKLNRSIFRSQLCPQKLYNLR